jgi:predicted TIM-barrel fold metal-dependent hydrolase
MIIDSYCTLGDERETRQSAGDLLERLRVCKVAKAIVAPEDREIAFFNRAGNDRILAIAGAHRDVLIPACTVNPWSGRDGITELYRAVKAGAKMLVLAPAVQGFMLTDCLIDDLLQAAAEIRVPVYVHTGPQSHAAPTQLALVAQKHPQTRFIMGHCGSTDHAWDMPAILQMKLDNLWYETSFVRPWVVPNYFAALGEDRFIFGSSSPRNDLRMELSHLARHWPAEVHPKTYSQNIQALLSEVIHDC